MTSCRWEGVYVGLGQNKYERHYGVQSEQGIHMSIGERGDLIRRKEMWSSTTLVGVSVLLPTFIHNVLHL